MSLPVRLLILGARHPDGKINVTKIVHILF